MRRSHRTLTVRRLQEDCYSTERTIIDRHKALKASLTIYALMDSSIHLGWSITCVTYVWTLTLQMLSYMYLLDHLNIISCPKVTNFLTCSTQLSTKFQLLIKTKILTNEEISCFKYLRCCIYHNNKC